MGFLDSLKSGKFVILSEIDPSKGVDVSALFEIADHLKGRVDALNIADMPSAVMTMGSMAASYLLKERGFDTIYNISCRDRNSLALQSDILSASALGIENIFITKGEDITFGDHPNVKPVNDVSVDELFDIVKRLRDGFDAGNNALNGSPELNVGAYVNCNAEKEELDLEIMELGKRVEQEISFVITPAVFDLKLFEAFIKKVKHFNIPIIAGIILLKTVGTARYLNKHIDNVNVPDPIIERLATAGDRLRESIAITADLISGMSDLCQGVNIMAMGWESKIPAFLEEVYAKI